MKGLLITVAVVGALVLAACGGADGGSAPPAAEMGGVGTQTGDSKAPERDRAAENGRDAREERPGTTIATGDSAYGEILFDGSEQAIYLFDRESSETSECYGACAAAWPPVLTEGDPKAAGGVEAKLLGRTRRDDGSTQVTYDGHPLYYYVDDPVGEVLCHNVEEFGGLWLVLEPDGDAVQ